MAVWQVITLVMCQLVADFTGCVNVMHFLTVCMSLIPTFFDALPFMERVEHVMDGASYFAVLAPIGWSIHTLISRKHKKQF